VAEPGRAAAHPRVARGHRARRRRARGLAGHQDVRDADVLRAVGVDGAAVRHQRPDPGAEGELLGERRPARGRRRLRGPRWVARTQPGARAGPEGAVRHRPLPRRWPPREAGHRRRGRPRRVLRLEGAGHGQRRRSRRGRLPDERAAGVREEVRRPGARGPFVGDGRQP
ncbi:MAG: Signal peptidase I, partial [uncultured Nocardioidaceae bacterium]